MSGFRDLYFLKKEKENYEKLKLFINRIYERKENQVKFDMVSLTNVNEILKNN